MCGNLLAITASEDNVRVYDINTGKCVREIGLSGRNVKFLAVSGDCDIAYSGYDGYIYTNMSINMFEGRKQDSEM